MKTFLFLLIVCSSLWGCKESKIKYPPETGTMKSAYYVQTYLSPSDFDLERIEGTDKLILTVFFKGESVSCLYPVGNKETFEELATTYHDGTYTGSVLPYANKALSAPLSSVSVVCDQDFDANHQENQSLSDIVLFCATSPYSYILDGYKNEVKESNYPDYWADMIMNKDGGYRPIELRPDAVNSRNTPLIYPICYLYFEKQPAQKGEYSFTVSIQTAGRKIKKVFHLLL